MAVSDDELETLAYIVENGPVPYDHVANQHAAHACHARGWLAFADDDSGWIATDAGVSQYTNPAQTEAGRKFDGGKPDLTLLPTLALERITRALEHGAQKYGRDNWRVVTDRERRYKAAAGRHLFAMMRGEIMDADSGLPHAHLLGANALFLAEIAAEPGKEEGM